MASHFKKMRMQVKEKQSYGIALRNEGKKKEGTKFGKAAGALAMTAGGAGLAGASVLFVICKILEFVFLIPDLILYYGKWIIPWLILGGLGADRTGEFAKNIFPVAIVKGIVAVFKLGFPTVIWALLLVFVLFCACHLLQNKLFDRLYVSFAYWALCLKEKMDSLKGVITDGKAQVATGRDINKNQFDMESYRNSDMYIKR